MAKKVSRKGFLSRKNLEVVIEQESEPPKTLLDVPAIGLRIDLSMSTEEETSLENLLKEYKKDSSKTDEDLKKDFSILKEITKEIKSITAQSILLHGERIKRAHEILCDYREGVFTKWIMQTYGNRATPYSMLHYYNFYNQLKPALKEKLKQMPRKAAYRLAAREGDLQIKEKILNESEGQQQKELIEMIQKSFPIRIHDKRKSNKLNIVEQQVKECVELCNFLRKNIENLNDQQLEELREVFALFSEHTLNR